MHMQLCQKIYMTPPLTHWSPRKAEFMSDENKILVMLSGGVVIAFYIKIYPEGNSLDHQS